MRYGCATVALFFAFLRAPEGVSIELLDRNAA